METSQNLEFAATSADSSIIVSAKEKEYSA